MKISVIISFYKRLDNLELILLALERQSNKQFDVIIAEDDDAQETKTFLNKYSGKSNLEIFHVCHEDRGFRKNKILNMAVIKSNSEFLIFIDGDCIPHKHFIQQYSNQPKEKSFLAGSRAMLSQNITVKLLKNKKFSQLNVVNLILTGAKRWEDAIYIPIIPSKIKKARGLCGCNWGVLKKYLLQINGFDENYKAPGVGEDVDVEWRLQQIGCEIKSVRNKSIVYHLYHKRNYSEDGVQKNYLYFEKIINNNNFICNNGIEKQNIQ